MKPVADIRIRAANDREINPGGDYVLYWMTAFRRTEYNFSLQRAVEWARDLKKPLVILEALRCGYPWASDRIHFFIIQGMADNARRLAEQKSVLYYPYLETEQGDGKGLLESLSQSSCLVIGDDFPCSFLPRMARAASRQIGVRFELVDSNGLLPMREANKVFLRAHDYRRFLQKNLRPYLDDLPEKDPLLDARLPIMSGVPRQILERWPAADPESLAKDDDCLKNFWINHQVKVAPNVGGPKAAQDVLRDFLEYRLPRYATDRNQPEQEVGSGLSSYLHFGHISAHEVFGKLMEQEQWTTARIATNGTGSADGWWGASPAAESFLDELITWREVGYNMCWQRDDYDQYESLPDWAQKTLAEHTNDPREYAYLMKEFESGETHDGLWNAAQRQLVREGRIHSYLRMLWGKKILEWSSLPQDALDVMIELNNKYALDGRNPNSYSGIFWCLGRYDRAWGPERPIFGKVRYMSSDNTARKFRVKQYIEKYS